MISLKENFRDKAERNARVQRRYDELMAAGRHGHYETLFRVVNEEVERIEAMAFRLINDELRK